MIKLKSLLLLKEEYRGHHKSPDKTHANVKKLHKNRGYTLIELLCVMLIFCLMMGLLLPSLSRGFFRCKAWVWGIYAFHENRLNVYLDENQKYMDIYSTNRPTPWSFIDSKGHEIK